MVNIYITCMYIIFLEALMLLVGAKGCKQSLLSLLNLGMNQDSKVVKKRITWLPPLFALNMFTHLTILRDCWPCLRERGELPDKSQRDA